MPGLSFYDRQHIQKMLIQQGTIGNIFNQFSREIAGYLRKWTETGKPNVWVRNAGVEKGVDRALVNLHKNLLDNIQSFGMDAWKRGQTKNDDLVKSYIEGMSISSVAKDGMFYRNQEALTASLKYVNNGMSLSDRVWKAVDVAKDQIELFLESGLSTGRAAGEISSDVRQLLKKPDKRFRRVRDENGKLQLSAPMKDYHPGQGVYRSSHMNALRLSATTTNISYRQADYDRWKNMDFVLGIEINRSSSKREPCKICDAMVGKYPKDYVFLGNHPFCVCVATPILMDHEDFADYLLDDTVPKGKLITHIPSSAKDFINDNYEAVKESYTVKNNKEYFKGQPIPASKELSLISREQVKQQRAEIKEWAKSNLIGKSISITNLHGPIGFTMAGIKEALNQPHKDQSAKNAAMKNIEKLISEGKYIKFAPDEKDNAMVVGYHYIEIDVAGGKSYAVIREMRDGKSVFYSIVEKIKGK